MKRQQERRAELERKAGRDVSGEPKPKRRRLDDGTERIEMELRFIRYVYRPPRLAGWLGGVVGGSAV